MSRLDASASPEGMVGNLFDDLPDANQANEIFQTLLSSHSVRIERIVSTGQTSPTGFWYDQLEAEWVLLIQGSAIVRFEDETDSRRLVAGDYLYIAPRRRHRVDMTQTNPPTIWLAIHLAD